MQIKLFSGTTKYRKLVKVTGILAAALMLAAIPKSEVQAETASFYSQYGGIAGLFFNDEYSVDSKVMDALQVYMENQEESEYANLALANVTHYVNVRQEPNKQSSIVGKIYSKAVAEIVEYVGDGDELWFKIISGNVEGYIKAEYFIYGEGAEDVIEEYITHYATCLVSRLNIRAAASTDSKRIGYLNRDEKIEVIEDQGEWIKVKYSDKEGYVSAEYVSVTEEFQYAISIEEERAREAALAAQKAREQAAETKTPEKITEIVFPSNNYTSNEELRQAIVNYAMQFEGNKYVHGGNSLTTGTDCSGFTSLIYKEFGYSLSRTPGGQYKSNGRSIGIDEIQPGDIICYSKGGSTCKHVALYIGDGKIIHAANSRKGVIVSNAEYMTIIGVKNVID